MLLDDPVRASAGTQGCIYVTDGYMDFPECYDKCQRWPMLEAKRLVRRAIGLCTVAIGERKSSVEAEMQVPRISSFGLQGAECSIA